ncbi:M50 family metallopeptidase [Corynebacterium coyleae]|uniref:M50 family metallopeptidase n=1 Tax=Corynebacterium coyleae TaxID=53374 RepID=UPI00254AEF19|nr:M50 family metallopeptidase [Corynebacterium coyleae]MDK8662848.1 M50 family metallopeptidase [Corynebacterium coyleae]MDK8706106.1 M50 family metallopeptidase [Corynebacterium coyleae]MDK8732807.1 M50 family metallopeptidase [Corynebacterium coyleae]MDK8822415.1 M50 family metallopeptidase [Corynebacterium coyleae]MDK8892147.1 M50 family metallopeptidase [Corynebacterium coyleae]
MSVLGIVLFALAITASIALHEAGHMFTARAFGMRVRRFFVGFGPTLWSVKRGGTEYGIAALPFGGFCDIAGMTAMDPVTEEEAPHAMVKKPAWQRIAVLSGGIVMNILIGVVIIFGVAVSSGIRNPYADFTPKVGQVVCVADQVDEKTLAECSGPGPAGQAGVQVGDTLVAVDDEPIETFADLRTYVAQRPGEMVALEVERGGSSQSIDVPVARVERIDPSTGERIDVGAVGIAAAPVKDAVKQFGPVEAVPATAKFTGQMLRASVDGLMAFPGKIPGVVASIFGGERDIEGPISVIGASRTGGELVERDQWPAFWMMLASLNFFLALFNLVPLPPLDGGHIAVVIYEKIRNVLRRLRGLPPAGPANYEKLMPLTYFMAALLLVVGVLVMAADVVNPVNLFG